MDNLTKIKLAWKYRTQLWKYRKLIRRRRQIATIAFAGAGLAAGYFAYRGAAPAIRRLTA